MSNTDLVKFIIKICIYQIISKMIISVMDSITISFLTSTNQDKYYVYFSASLIQNIGFKTVGFGLIFPASVFGSQEFGKRNFYRIGCLFNLSRMIAFFFFIIIAIYSFSGNSNRIDNGA